LLDKHLAALYGVQTRVLIYAPYAFTEQGVAMLSSVLNSERAIAAILSAIRELINPPPPKRRPIGFTANLALHDVLLRLPPDRLAVLAEIRS
jgi:hypothetical protein